MPFPDSKSTAWEFFTDDYFPPQEMEAQVYVSKIVRLEKVHRAMVTEKTVI